jgi:hypothetical protein
VRTLARGFILAMAVAAQSPIAIVSANASTEPPSCLRSSPHVQASFVLNDDGPRARITSVKVTGLDPTECNNVPVKLRLLGNAAGNPSAPAASLLSTLDSHTNPCTGSASVRPILVASGSITLPACATDVAAVGTSIDVHDLTLLVVRIRSDEVSFRSNGGGTAQECEPGVDTCVLGEKVTRQLGAAGPHAHSLAFTGGWIARLTAIGAAALALGLLLSVVRRRRNRQSLSSTTLTMSGPSRE